METIDLQELAMVEGGFSAGALILGCFFLGMAIALY